MLTVDVCDAGFSLRARLSDEPVLSRYGPVVLHYADVSSLLRNPALVHDDRRQLQIAGVDDTTIESWFSSLLIFPKSDDHRHLRGGLSAMLSSSVFDPEFTHGAAR